MGLIGADGFLQLCTSYRLIWIGGRFGGGKTSFAFKLSQELLESGYRLITNAKSIWADDLDSLHLDADGMLHAVVIMDEGGLGLKATRQVESMAAYAAKMDVVYFFPSFFPPIRAAQVVVVQPLFGLVNIGIPLILYRWRVKMGSFEDKGHFVWWNPSEVWGIYSRRAPEGAIDQLIAYLSAQVDAYRKHFGVSTNGLPGVEAYGVTESDIISDSAGAFADAADSIASVSTGKNRRR